MLLREFLEEDMVNFLDGIANTVKKVDYAQEADLESTLHPFNAFERPHEDDLVDPSLEATSFVPPKTFDSVAPQINVVIEPQSISQSSSPVESVPVSQPAPLSTASPTAVTAPLADNSIDTANPIGDSNSLRRVIREELSDLKNPSPLPYTPTSSSPSQLRQAIKDELNSIIVSGRIPQLARGETLRSIIHDELEKTGAIDDRHHFSPERIHIDESLLNPSLATDDLKIIELMQKDPGLRTRREELSVLGKLEDYLVDLKIVVREGSRKDAMRKYHRLKKEALSLQFFMQERKFILSELELLGKSLFDSTRGKQGVTKVIIKESTGEIMEPLDFKKEDLDIKKPVYHVGVDKEGKTSLVNSPLRSLMKKPIVQKDLFSEESQTQKIALASLPGKKTKSSPLSSLPKKKIFYVLEKDGDDAKKIVYHKKLGKRKDFHLFSEKPVFDSSELKDLSSKASDRFEDIKRSSLGKNATPWEDKKQQMHNPIHTKEYLKAVYALRQKNKALAVSLLRSLHGKYPKNVAIRVRLHDALEL